MSTAPCHWHSYQAAKPATLSRVLPTREAYKVELEYWVLPVADYLELKVKTIATRMRVCPNIVMPSRDPDSFRMYRRHRGPRVVWYTETKRCPWCGDPGVFHDEARP